jgi:hypothetical protein
VETCEQGYICLEGTKSAKMYPAPAGYYVPLSDTIADGESQMLPATGGWSNPRAVEVQTTYLDGY